MNIAISGPHGAGKSTLGKALARELQLPFHEEVGWELARDASWRSAEQTAEHSAEAFDVEVFRRELQRDLAWARGQPRVVETWHPGNLAYAALRSPRAVRRALPSITRACRGLRAVVLPVEAPREVLASRQHEPGDLEFFIQVGQNARDWALRLGLQVLPPVNTHLSDPEMLARQVAQQVAAATEITHPAQEAQP